MLRVIVFGALLGVARAEEPAALTPVRACANDGDCGGAPCVAGACRKICSDTETCPSGVWCVSLNARVKVCDDPALPALSRSGAPVVDLAAKPPEQFSPRLVEAISDRAYGAAFTTLGAITLAAAAAAAAAMWFNAPQGADTKPILIVGLGGGLIGALELATGHSYNKKADEKLGLKPPDPAETPKSP
jgi:hypothetical protein